MGRPRSGFRLFDGFTEAGHSGAMAITIARGVRSRMREQPESFILQVRGAKDPEAATAGLASAAKALFEEMLAKFAAPPMPSPEGPWILVDAADQPRRVLDAILDLVVAHLESAGVGEATLSSPRNDFGPFNKAVQAAPTPRVVSLRLYPEPPRVEHYQRSKATLPQAWLEEALAFVSDGLGDSDRLTGIIELMESPLTLGDVAAFWDHCRRAETMGAGVFTGDPGTTLRGANPYFFGWQVNLSMGMGGPTVSDEELADQAEAFVELARRLAPEVSQAFVSLDSNYGFGLSTDWMRETRVSYRHIEMMSDELIFDAFAYQVLGPGHLARLGGLPAGARPLEGGRFELRLGQWHDWLPDSPNTRVAWRDEGRRLLAPCLLNKLEANRRFLERRIDNSAEVPF